MQPLVHVVGARPNFVKAAPVVRALEERGLPQRVVHTGQHYDEALSDVFFRQLDLPKPDLDLGVGSGTHARQTAALLVALEDAFDVLEPGMVVVYGDVNSTLAAALVATKLELPLAHVEAGLRSFDNSMPEEINRRVTDTLSDLLFATSADAVAHLAREGVAPERIHLVGNPMIDTLVANLDRFVPQEFRAAVGLGATEPYVVVTMHRPANVDGAGAARGLVEALATVAASARVVFPVHPRGRATLAEAGLDAVEGLTVLEPLGYVEFLSALRGAALVVTDSGGVQEETTILGVPCLTVRPNTERPITITDGTNTLVSPGELPARASEILSGARQVGAARPPLWDGSSGPRIAAVLDDFAKRSDQR